MSQHIQPINERLLPDIEPAGPALAGSWLRAARIGWHMVAAVSLLILISSLPAYGLRMSGELSHATTELKTTGVVLFGVLSGLASLASALLSLGLALIFYRSRFEEPAAAALSFYLLVYAIVMAGPLEGWTGYWIDDVGLAVKLQAILLATPSVALFLLFPNGRFVPAWSRWVLVLTIPWNISLFLLPSFEAASMASMNPVELAGMAIWYMSFLAVGLYAQIYRYRRASTSSERQQTKWVVFGFGLWMFYMSLSTGPYLYIGNLAPGAAVPWWVPASELGWFLSLNIVPVSLAIAVARYRLWDINLVINRALVYGTLTVCVVAIYALVVGTAGTLLQAQGNAVIAFVATGIVAVLFQPLRERLQRWVNRLIYGQRDEPFEVIANLGKRLEGTLEPELVYPTIVETVAQTLKLPYVAIGVKQGDGFDTVESYGKPAAEMLTFPLTYQSEEVGVLQVARQSPNESFTEPEQRLLRSIAIQAGTAVHAVQLTADLQKSRQRLVTAREEERRRLRRDLHDGLGPTLAAHMLKIGSVRSLLQRDPETAGKLLAELEADTENTVTEIRRFVYELRPPALDQLGLVGAIEETADGYSGRLGSGAPEAGERGINIHVQAPEKLPPLPAAVEVAAYRIAQEALTNVVRHAQADRCDVVMKLKRGTVSRTGVMRLEINDDGDGLAAGYRFGVGLASMRERAEEIGGTLLISSERGSGTRVIAELPYSEDGAQ